MALASLITFPLGMVFFMLMMAGYNKNYARTVAATNTLNDTAVEYIGGIEVIKVFGKAKSSYEKFVTAAKECAQSYIDWMNKSNFFFTFAMNIMPATLLSVLPIGGLLLKNGTLTPEKFILIVILSMGLITPIIGCMKFTDDTDEGISGTNTKHRAGFNEMIEDALAEKIDLIVTKSVSRFARNTVDSLVTIRKLKEKGVQVYFEKENIYTFDGKGELLLTIMSSLAQEESRSISENVTWGQRKRFADGKVNLPYKQFLGYRKGADGFPEVVPEEAVIVRRIYTRFMEGLTPGAIAKELTADGIPTPSGKQRWQTSTVESILQNEKYKGAALLQKCFTVDFLTKKRKVNEGEVPQYYVEHSHEPIITPEEFDKVQTELARRKRISRQYSGKSIFSSRIVCGDCGSYFGSKVWNSTSKYRRVIWQCNGKFKGEHKCETPHLDEETIKARFVAALNAIIDSKDNILGDCRLMQTTLTDCTGIDAEIESLLEEIEVVAELTKRCIAENSQTAQNQEEYAARYNGFVERYEKAKVRLEQLRATKAAREAQTEAIGAFMFEVQELDTLTEFDEKLWLTIIDTVTVHSDGRLTFKFQGGTETEG